MEGGLENMSLGGYRHSGTQYFHARATAGRYVDILARRESD